MNRLWGSKKQSWMGVGMIADLMPGIANRARDLRVAENVHPALKESASRVVLAQAIENL